MQLYDYELEEKLIYYLVRPLDPLAFLQLPLFVPKSTISCILHQFYSVY